MRTQKPLVHCITNPISINDCANIALAAGARPIMAEHPEEAAEITAAASALAVNLGNITDVRMESMLIAGKTALELNIPVIIDLVGVGCSSLRLRFAKQFLDEVKPWIVKGNISEIRAVCGKPSHAVGIDAGEPDMFLAENPAEELMLTAGLAESRSCTVMVTGKTDLVACCGRRFAVDNGTARLAEITGTGCMLNVLTAACMAGSARVWDAEGTKACQRPQMLEPALLAAAWMGIAGEKAAALAAGPGSFRTALLDCIYNVTEQDIRERAKIKEYTDESQLFIVSGHRQP